jgi:site-specific recombinase XerD
MEKEYFISMWLDVRKPKASGKYPVKLRVFTPHPRKQMLYTTVFEFTKSEFKSIWETLKPREEHKEKRNEIRAVETLANDIAKVLSPFSFTQFEKKYLRNTGDGGNIIYQYNQTINKKQSNNSFGTASNYDLSLKSLKGFILHTKGKEPVKIPFADITPDWLQKYENYMINHLKRSRTTVGIYLRPLRAIFNSAIAEKEIDIEIYPFGKNKYQPPTGRNVKKALSQSHLKQLFDAKPQTAEQIKAKDFWFFSYTCNGMNVKDISLLKYENIQEDKIIFYRAKTINTSKTDLRPVTVYLNDFSKMIIKKYGNKNTGKSEYIFPIISDKETELVKHSKIKNFTKFINQNLKKLATIEGITSDISTYWARHSFATNSIRNGASMEFVMEALSHNNMKTTVGYFAGFEDKDKKEFMQKLMDF